jgi:hypothetical protein
MVTMTVNAISVTTATDVTTTSIVIFIVTSCN